jgi:hypothetical protein
MSTEFLCCFALGKRLFWTSMMIKRMMKINRDIMMLVQQKGLTEVDWQEIVLRGYQEVHQL